MNYLNKSILLLVLLLFYPATQVFSFINPNFTPINLIEQSQVIYVLEFSPANNDGLATAKVLKTIKGEQVEAIEVDLFAGAFEAQGQMVIDLLAGGHTQAILFAGAYTNNEQEMDDVQMQRQGYIHLAGKWLVVGMWEDDLWEMEKIDSLMLGTWAGSTDMLLKAVQYVTTDPYALIPVNCGVSWDKPLQLGEISTGVTFAVAVDISQTGREDLYIAAKSGDRVYRWADDTLTDITATIGLTANSAASTWADIDCNGTLDLVSYDNEGFAIHYQTPKGKFQKKACNISQSLKGGYVNISIIDNKIIAGGGGLPVILTVKNDNTIEVAELPAGDIEHNAIKKNVACLVADFDNDGRTDILQPAQGGNFLYRGAAGGSFTPPQWGPIADDNGAVCLGDYDADGLLDVLVVGQNANQLWHNIGQGQFQPTLDVSGEISYIAKPGGIVAQTGDINNDGRQDVLIGYGVELSPQLFFNRGFRSFGHARMIDIAEQKLLPEASIGQQAACLGDFNNDGAMDMAIVLADGATWTFMRQVDGESALAARAGVGLQSQVNNQPINIWAVKDGWPMGAWSVRAGQPAAFFGAMEPGPIEIFWRTDNGQVNNSEVIVEDGPIFIDITQP